MKNFYSRIAVILLVSFLFGHTSWGQSYSRISMDEVFIAMEDLFESNQALVNGVFFVDKYRNDIGHPFLNSPYFSEGTFSFSDIDYSNCKLGYNLVDQNIVIVEKSDIKVENPFIPPVEFIREFQMGDMTFKKGTSDNRFYLQVLECEQFTVLAYLYKKAAKSFHKKNILAYKYSDIVVDIFITMNGRQSQIVTKRNYLSLFPSEIEKNLSVYIKRNRISFKKSDISELKELFNYTRKVLELNETNLVVKKPQEK